MITYKSAAEVELMRKAGEIVRDLHLILEKQVRAGITTAELDKIAAKYIRERGAEPNFLNYNGYPASICVSIEDEVVHGIPGKRALKEGEIVSIDLGACLNGYHSDAARTYAVGEISKEKQRLIRVTEECFFEGIKQIRLGARLGDISSAIQAHAEKNGYSVVRELSGHGIGKALHEDPSIPNFGTAGRGVRLAEGMVLAIEPMVNEGYKEVVFLSDGWTVVTKDGSPSAHYENTVAFINGRVEILTL